MVSLFWPSASPSPGIVIIHWRLFWVLVRSQTGLASTVLIVVVVSSIVAMVLLAAGIPVLVCICGTILGFLMAIVILPRRSIPLSLIVRHDAMRVAPFCPLSTKSEGNSCRQVPRSSFWSQENNLVRLLSLSSDAMVPSRPETEIVYCPVG